MNVTWVMGPPTGEEHGRYLALDLGGTNLRVCEVSFEAFSDFEVLINKNPLPEEVKHGTAEELWDYVAECLQRFLHEHHTGPSEKKVPLAIAFSYPVTQSSLRSGILQRWTKGLDVKGVEGHDIVPQLEAAIGRKVGAHLEVFCTREEPSALISLQGLPIDIVAVVNDTVGTLITAARQDPEVKIGSIFGTGCNAAYFEEASRIPKIHGRSNIPDDALVAINAEYGAFDDERKVLPCTRFDDMIDQSSARPGQQTYEKMVSGLYLGEILRMVFLDLHESGALFQGADPTLLRQQNVIDASFLSAIDLDVPGSVQEMGRLFKQKLGIEPSLPELRICRQLVEMVGIRAARLYACGIAAICKKNNWSTCRVAVDGAVFENYTNFRKRTMAALGEIFDWPPETETRITLQHCKEGSEIGSALIAALASEGPRRHLLQT